jgi:ABC-type branched-subunit amino acid transport system substrate-binding protein
MRRGSRRAAVIAVLLTTAVAAVGFGGAAGAKPASGEPLRFGFVDGFPAGANPPTLAQGAQAYVDDWNKRGGFNGQPIDYIEVEPAGFSASAYIAAVSDLIDNKHVLALLSMGNCPYTIPAVRVSRTPTWGSTASPACGLDDDFMLSQQGGFAGTAPALPAFTYAVDQGSKLFAVTYPSVIAGPIKTMALDPLENYLKHHPEVKTKFVGIPVPLSLTGADADAVIENMKSQGVDSVFPFITEADIGLLLSHAATQGFAPSDGINYYLGSNLHTKAVAALPDAEGAYVLDTAYPVEDTKNPEVKKANKILKGKVDQIDGYAQGGYQAAGFLENSLKGLKGKVTSASLLAHWKKIGKVKYPLSPVKFSMTNPNHPAGGEPLQLKNGAFVPVGDFIVVQPKEFAPT